MFNAFEGAELDPEAQAEIHRALTACADRRRALEQDPENDPERFYIGAAETAGYLGQLESGVEGDWVEYAPEGEHRWEDLGEGGEAERIDRVLAGMEERKAAMTPEQIASEQAEHEAEVQRMRAQQALPPVLSLVEGPPTEPDPDDPRLDWRNWSDSGYVAVRSPEREGDQPEPLAEAGGGPLPWRRKDRPKPLSLACPPPAQALQERQLKPPFTEPDEGRSRSVAAVGVERRKLAGEEAERRKRKKGDAKA